MRHQDRNYSDLRGGEQVPALNERVVALQAPGAEAGGQRHLGGGAGWGAGAAAGLAAGDQGAQAALGGVVGAWHAGVAHEAEQVGQVRRDPGTQPALRCRCIRRERRT